VLAALGLSGLFSGLLFAIGLLRAPLVIGLVLPTTAFGMLLPILHESGELGPMILASIVLAHQHHHLHETLLTLVFLAIAIGTIILARSLRSERLSRMSNVSPTCRAIE
jgi:hypothetical protein